MFSIMTIASSTTKPEATVSAISERLSRLNPHSAMPPNVATSETGRVTLGITVAQSLRRNRKITSTTRATVSTRVNCTSAMAARMVIVRSVTTETFSPGGTCARRRGSRSRTASTTAMVLAPGWRWMSRMTAGAPLNQPASSASSGPSMARPISRSFTGAPLR